MRFKLTHKVHHGISFFTDEDAPDWLTCKNQVKGSTMDNSWFFRSHVLVLAVGESAESEFSVIERVE